MNMERRGALTKKFYKLFIACSHCGPRHETQFLYRAEGGGVFPDPNALTDREWAKYLHIRANPKGWLSERWVHSAGCGRWFNLWRNTITHEIGPAWLPFTSQPKAPRNTTEQEGSRS